jgi:hypothetical protein
LSVNRLLEHIVRGNISADDIVYWQISGGERNYLRMSMEHKKWVAEVQRKYFDSPGHHFRYTEYKNIFDGQPRIDLLCNSPILIQNYLHDPADNLQILLGTILLLKKYTSKLLIAFGWSTVLEDPDEEVFKQILQERGVDYLEEYFVDYSKENGLEMLDDGHPAKSAGEQYAEQIIYKKIQDLGWI